VAGACGPAASRFAPWPNARGVTVFKPNAATINKYAVNFIAASFIPVVCSSSLANLTAQPALLKLSGGCAPNHSQLLCHANRAAQKVKYRRSASEKNPPTASHVPFWDCRVSNPGFRLMIRRHAQPGERRAALRERGRLIVNNLDARIFNCNPSARFAN
jgi:hypothetical protein